MGNSTYIASFLCFKRGLMSGFIWCKTVSLIIMPELSEFHKCFLFHHYRRASVNCFSSLMTREHSLQKVSNGPLCHSVLLESGRGNSRLGRNRIQGEQGLLRIVSCEGSSQLVDRRQEWVTHKKFRFRQKSGTKNHILWTWFIGD